ncbi:MAG: N-acetyltransferase family protein [Saprospiraceae bacterium]
MTTLRSATPSDLENLTDLFEAYRAFYEKTPDREGARQFLKDRMERGEAEIFIALEDGVAVGFAQLYPLFSSTRMKRLWLLNDLFAAPEHRGKGISKLLLERAKQLAHETGAREIMLETAKTNDIGNQLYPSAGFELGTDFNWYHWEPQNTHG